MKDTEQKIDNIGENLLRHYLGDEFDYVDQTVLSAAKKAILQLITEARLDELRTPYVNGMFNPMGDAHYINRREQLRKEIQ